MKEKKDLEEEIEKVESFLIRESVDPLKKEVQEYIDEGRELAYGPKVTMKIDGQWKEERLYR